MKSFEGLLVFTGTASADEGRKAAVREFRSLVSHSNLNLWRPGDPIASQGRRFLLGVGLYWIADLRLLDALSAILSNSGTGAIDRVDVFDVLTLKDAAEFEEYIPGFETTFDIPLVGVWEDGVMKERAWGARARDLLIRYFPGLSSVRFF